MRKTVRETDTKQNETRIGESGRLLRGGVSGLEERGASGIEDQLPRKAGRKPAQVHFRAL